MKEGVKRTQGKDFETKLLLFLFDYQITPHSVAGIARRNCWWIDSWRHAFISSSQISVGGSLPCKPDSRRSAREGSYLHNRWSCVRSTVPWQPGTIEQQTGPESYTVFHRSLSHRSTTRKTIDSPVGIIGDASTDGDIPWVRDTSHAAPEAVKPLNHLRRMKR